MGSRFPFRRPSRTRLWALAVLPALLLLWLALPGEPKESPRCDDAGVLRQVVSIFNTHPDYVGRSPHILLSVADPVEIEHRWHPQVNRSANTRWCEGRARYGNGRAETVHYDLFSTATILGTAYGVRPCYGSRDPRHQDCSFAKPPQR
jgi:hypothetical protein